MHYQTTWLNFIKDKFHTFFRPDEVAFLFARGHDLGVLSLKAKHGFIIL